MNPAERSLYSSIVRERYRRPRRFGGVPNPDAAFEEVNPLCGDRVRMELRLSNGRVADARFAGDSCAICTASADLLAEIISGRSLAEVERITAGDLLRLLEAEIRPSRMGCVTLPLKALKGAVAAAEIRA
jgi:nitrogen fixation NifU-like protein